MESGVEPITEDGGAKRGRTTTAGEPGQAQTIDGLVVASAAYYGQGRATILTQDYRDLAA